MASLVAQMSKEFAFVQETRFNLQVGKIPGEGRKRNFHSWMKILGHPDS